MSGPLTPPDPSTISSNTQALAGAEDARLPGRTFGDGPPEPTRVYGYVAFVDPSTGSEYLPHGTTDPIRTYGWPGGISLNFATADGREVHLGVGGGQDWWDEAVRNPGGSVVYRHQNSGGVAWYYDIVLEQDRAAGEPVEQWEDNLPEPRTSVVRYNPDYYRFAGVGPAIGFVGDGGAPATFTRRAGPFPDLPDTL